MTPAFNENVVIITGASSGIGAEMARQLADQGAWLSLAARSVDALTALAAECVQRGGRALVLPTDVGIEEQCKALIDCTLEEYGRIDTLINNAGVGMISRVDELQTTAPFEEVMRINYLGSVWPTYYALPHLKQTRGRIVSVSSVTGKSGVPTRSGYAASKHALYGFFDSLRIELEESGVTVTIFSPDFVVSGIRENAFSANGSPIGKGNSPVQEDKIMTTEHAVRIALKGIERRRREVLTSPRSKVGQWLKLIAPKLVDNIAKRAIEEGR